MQAPVLVIYGACRQSRRASGFIDVALVGLEGLKGGIPSRLLIQHFRNVILRISTYVREPMNVSLIQDSRYFALRTGGPLQYR